MYMAAEDDYADDEPTDFFPRLVAGRFVLGNAIGASRRTTTFAAVDGSTNERVAVKLLNATLTENTKARRRFLTEGRVMSSIDHPNIARVFECAEDEGTGQMYLVMELVDGVTLQQALSKGYHFSTVDALDVGLDVLAGLAALHHRGEVHRDVQPGNILLHPDGRAIVGDFGSVLAQPDPDAVEDGVTDVGEELGRMGFIAPEQRGDAHDVTRAADMFSVGALLAAMLTDASPADLSLGSLREQALSGLPALVAPVVRRATEWRAEDRHVSAVEMAAELLAIRDGVARELGRELRGDGWLTWLRQFTPPPTAERMAEPTLGSSMKRRQTTGEAATRRRRALFRAIRDEVVYQADQFGRMADQYPMQTAFMVTSMLVSVGALIYMVL